MKKQFLSLLLLIGLTSVAFAQSGTIKGTIVDATTKEAIIGGSVILKGTTPPVGS